MNLDRDIKLDLMITLFIFWMLLTFEFSLMNIVVGLVISIGISLFTYDYFYFDVVGKSRIPNPLKLIYFMMKIICEIYVASWSHVLRIVKMDHNPGLIYLKLDIEEPLIITLIANAITMTPGTITLDIKENVLTILTIKDTPKDREKIEYIVKEKLESIFLHLK